MRKFANLKTWAVCGGGICLICSHASLIPPCLFAPSQHSWLTYLLTYLITYLPLTPWSRVLLAKLTGSQLVKTLSTFYGTRKFITAFTSARHISLSWARSIQSIHPYLTYWRSVLILSSHLRPCLPSDLFPSGFPTKTLYTLLLSTWVFAYWLGYGIATDKFQFHSTTCQETFPFTTAFTPAEGCPG